MNLSYKKSFNKYIQIVNFQNFIIKNRDFNCFLKLQILINIMDILNVFFLEYKITCI